MVGSGQRGIPLTGELTGDVMCGGYRYNRLFIFYGTFHTSGFAHHRPPRSLPQLVDGARGARTETAFQKYRDGKMGRHE